MKAVRRTILALGLGLAVAATGRSAERTVRTGLEGILWQSYDSVHPAERAFIEAARGPLLEGRDCAAALQLWFDGLAASSRGDKEAAVRAWEAAREALAGPAEVLSSSWPELPAGRLRPLDLVKGLVLYLVHTFTITWVSDAGRQYGLLMVPKTIPPGHRFPLFVYVHSGQAGLSLAEAAWLGEQCRRGYAVVAPALRGQPLGGETLPELARYRCEGVPGDPWGDAADVVSVMVGAAALPVVRAGSCALVGLGSGAAPALLAAAHSAMPGCVAVADAERLNPFRAYWSCMARDAKGWPEWPVFCSREPAEQLAAMARQSAAHQAGSIRCPVLMLLPEESLATLDEEAHRDVLRALGAGGAEASLETVAGARRGFTRDAGSDQCQEALRRLARFARGRVPPDDGKDALLPPPPEPAGENHGR